MEKDSLSRLSPEQLNILKEDRSQRVEVVFSNEIALGMLGVILGASLTFEEKQIPHNKIETYLIGNREPIETMQAFAQLYSASLIEITEAKGVTLTQEGWSVVNQLRDLNEW